MAKSRPEQGDLIFSSEGGLSEAARAVGKGQARGQGRKQKGQGGAGRTDLPDDGVVRVARERRRGKGMTVVTGVPLGAAELKALGKQLKQRCGSGGTTRDGVIEIQGDHRDVVVEALEGRGWTVKKVGG